MNTCSMAARLRSEATAGRDISTLAPPQKRWAELLEQFSIGTLGGLTLYAPNGHPRTIARLGDAISLRSWGRVEELKGGGELGAGTTGGRTIRTPTKARTAQGSSLISRDATG